ncbi:hypothetical protein [Listeria booriae]|nr:hypothetical protein [Listeria booriae]
MIEMGWIEKIKYHLQQEPAKKILKYMSYKVLKNVITCLFYGVWLLLLFVTWLQLGDKIADSIMALPLKQDVTKMDIVLIWQMFTGLLLLLPISLSIIGTIAAFSLTYQEKITAIINILMPFTLIACVYLIIGVIHEQQTHHFGPMTQITILLLTLMLGCGLSRKAERQALGDIEDQILVDDLMENEIGQAFYSNSVDHVLEKESAIFPIKEEWSPYLKEAKTVVRVERDVEKSSDDLSVPIIEVYLDKKYELKIGMKHPMTFDEINIIQKVVVLSDMDYLKRIGKFLEDEKPKFKMRMLSEHVFFVPNMITCKAKPIRNNEIKNPESEEA